MADVTPYVNLLRAFLSGAMSVADFETEYLRTYKSDPTDWPEEEFQILDELFSDVDAFCANPGLRGEDDLDERQLRIQARAALGRLLGVRNKAKR